MTEIFQSNFVFGLQGNLYQEFIDKVANSIIQEIIGTDDYEIIDFDKHLSWLDFDKSKRKESIFPEFYLNFLGDIIKDTNGVSFKKKVCVTLDERLCTDICPNTGRKITTMKISGVELVYFIYFDVKEFFDFVYDKNMNTGIETKEQNLPLYQRLGYKDQNELNSVLRSSKKLVALLESLGVDIPTKQGKVNSIPAVSKYDKGFLELLNHQKSDVRDIVQAKLNMQSNHHQDNINGDYSTVEKIGYIHHINKDRGLSFVYDTPDNDSWFPIPHKNFPEIKNCPIGTAIKAYGYFNENKFYVENYEKIDADELPFQLIQMDGILKMNEYSRFAIIRTNIGSVFVESNFIKNFQPNIAHQVKCIAIETYDHKKQQDGWKAIYVENLDNI